jgi:hypothetical protein
MIQITIQPQGKKYNLTVVDQNAVVPKPTNATYTVPTFAEAQAQASAFIAAATDPATPAV